jgi:hypothetical protein
MEAPERALEIGYHIGEALPWFPVFAPVRKTEPFKAYVRKSGLVDYWRARGWPDLCRPAVPERDSAKTSPMGASDFECD